MKYAVRIQICCGYTLMAEAIVASIEEADRVWAAFTNTKYRARKKYGGAVISRADLPRTWDVPVGGTITPESCIWNRKIDNVQKR